MAEYGLGNFIYELEVKEGSAHFKFRDPEDAANTAETVVAQKDFDGFAADSRQVADAAFAQVSKVLNDRRDARHEKEAADEVAKKTDEDQSAREAAEDFHNNAQELGDSTPTGGQPDPVEDKKAPAHNPNPQPSVPDDSKPADTNKKADKKK